MLLRIETKIASIEDALDTLDKLDDIRLYLKYIKKKSGYPVKEKEGLTTACPEARDTLPPVCHSIPPNNTDAV